MTDARTCRCGKPLRDQHTTCDDCARSLSVALGDVPWLEQELETTISRQKGVDYRTKGGTRSSEKPLPIVPSAVEAKSHLKQLLVSWTRLCDEESVRHQSPKDGLPVDSITALSRWLMWRVDGLSLHEAGPDAVDEITNAVAHCRRLIDNRAERWFAGPCDQCQTELYATQEARTVVCGGCKSEYDVRERRAWLMKSARLHHATATEIARAVVVWGEASVGEARLVDRIRKWGDRGRIMVTGHVMVNGNQRSLYRVGDVMDLLEEDARAKSA